MARFVSQQKKGYYKTPPHLVPLIAQYLAVPEPENTRILDPCAGEGEALSLLGGALGVTQLYANELDEPRADACRQLPLQVACGDGVSELKTPDRSYSLLFLNPPYDDEGQGLGRTEEKFLSTIRCLRDGGILILIVPLEVLTRKAFVEKLPVMLKDIIICRFPGDDFAAFGQAVLFGRKRYGRIKAEESNYRCELQMGRVLGDGQLPEFGRYTVPPRPDGGFYFYSQNLDANTLDSLLAMPQTRKELSFGLTHEQSRAVRSLMPLRSGHQAVILATGLMDGAYRMADGSLWVVTGTTEVKENKSEEVEEDRTITRIRCTPTPRVTAFDLSASMAAGELVLRNLT